MRKQTKLVAVLSAAALLAIGASMTSFAAAAHWDQQDGEWVFVDRNGDRMTDVWKKSNGQWYYLDGDGYMAKEQIVEDDDDKYYVDANGARVTNTWISLDNDDLLDDSDESESIDTVWMYFDATGKALGAGVDGGEIKKLTYGDGQNGYFIFDEDGYMLSGWKRWKKNEGQTFDGDLYYLGTQDEGWARTNWQWLEIDPDLQAFEDIDTEDDNYKDECWFFFKSNGKAYKDDTAKYNNRTYSFDEYGRMLDLWVYPENDASKSDTGLTNKEASSSATKAAYYTEDSGERIGTDWVIAYPNTNYDNYSDDPYYFYLNSKGQPFRADKNTTGSAFRLDDGETLADQPALTDADSCAHVEAKAIKGETYLFNEKGVMLTGLYKLTNVAKGAGSIPNGIYYFTEDDIPSSVAGQMVTDKRITIDVDGDDETYYFHKSGYAYKERVISGYIYGEEGKLVTEYGDGNTYEMVRLDKLLDDDNGKDDYNGLYVFYDKKGNVEFYGKGSDRVLINENGKIKKSGKVKDVDDRDVRVDDYIVREIEGQKVVGVRDDVKKN